MICVSLPWPPAKTSPNASRQGNWRGKYDAAKVYKSDCRKECMAQGVRSMGVAQVDVCITFHPPRAGRFDLDNMLARAKQGLDAVALAIGVDDGDWRKMTLCRGEKVAGGRVVVEIDPSPVAVPIVGVIT